MNVKRYIAANVQEAMEKVKLELGRDAIILHTRKIKHKGLKGIFKKPLVEVVAAIEEKEVAPIRPVRPAYQPPVREAYPQEVAQEVLKPIVNQNVVPDEKPAENQTEITRLKEEMDEIKDLIKSYMKPKSENLELKEETAGTEDHLEEYLLSLDIDESIIGKIVNIVKRQINVADGNEDMLKSASKQAIKDFLGSPYTIDHVAGNQKVYVFVGPTGVGKTTTLAKIAAKLSLLDNKKVGLITADTYRIAAVDQLKTYSEILGIPLNVVYEASELQDVLFKYKDKDVILLDTAGRSHKSDELSRDLQDLINNLENPDIFLVLSLTTGYKDIKSILSSYDFIDDHKIIFTKLDEASSYSNMLNVRVDSGRPLSYITTGQSVPDDIEIAYPEKILDYIVGDSK